MVTPIAGTARRPSPTDESRSPHSPGDHPVIRVDNLWKRFPLRRSWAETLRSPLQREWHQVLRSVSFRVHRGEFFGLLGPNGAGKTTLFKVLSTLISPDEGRIEVAGHDLDEEPGAVREALTPVIADERSLNWRISGRENLRLFAGLYRMRRPDAEIDGLIDVVGLVDAADRMVGQYSSGMKQRLLIARALLSRPKVLLLDEPTRSLDPVSARNFRRFLQEDVVARSGCTILLATHNADEAFELCDRVAVLDRGRLIADGPATVLARETGQRLHRITVADRDVEAALRLLEAAGCGGFERHEEPEAGWTTLVGQIDGSPLAPAAVVRLLVEGGVAVSELARVPVPLADLIERLVDGRAES